MYTVRLKNCKYREDPVEEGSVKASFCRTIPGVRLCWELEEPKGPKGPEGPQGLEKGSRIPGV